MGSSAWWPHSGEPDTDAVNVRRRQLSKDVKIISHNRKLAPSGGDTEECSFDDTILD
jgi:hypothetical protein